MARIYTGYFEEKVRRVNAMIAELQHGPSDSNSLRSALIHLEKYAECLVSEARYKRNELDNRQE